MLQRKFIDVPYVSLATLSHGLSRACNVLTSHKFRCPFPIASQFNLVHIDLNDQCFDTNSRSVLKAAINMP